jgi:hypothetical protein
MILGLVMLGMAMGALLMKIRYQGEVNKFSSDTSLGERDPSGKEIVLPGGSTGN